jgi:hypothetical protein
LRGMISLRKSANSEREGPINPPPPLSLSLKMVSTIANPP